MKYLRYLLFDLVGSVCLGASIVSFAEQANFAPGGVNGLAVMIHFLWEFPVGWATILINVPIILFTFKRLGWRFFLISFKSMLLSSLFIDYVACYLPVFTGNRFIAAVGAAVLGGIGYSFFFNEGSSTGGTDFIIVAVKQKKPTLSFGALSLVIDGSVIILSVFVFHDWLAFVLGAVYTLLCSLCLDGTTWLLKKTGLSNDGCGTHDAHGTHASE